MRAEAPYAEVLEAVGRCALVHPRPPEVEWSFTSAVAAELDVSADSGRTGSWDRFAGQVRRALNRLAEQGTLVKVTEGRSTRFYRPEELEQRRAAARQANEQVAAQVTLWVRIREELAVYGYVSETPPGQPVTLSAGDWQRLLQVLNTGAS